MNKIFKKLLSTVLSVSFLSVSTISLFSLADGDYCFKNDKGGYFHPDCANDELAKVGFYKTADFVDIENLGMNGDEEHYAFNFRALDEVFEKKKLISTKNLNEQYDSLEKKFEDLSSIWNKKNIFLISSTSLIGFLVGLFSSKNSEKQDQVDKDAQHVPVSHSGGRAFSSLIWGLAGAIASIIGLKIKNEKDKHDVCNQKSKILNESVELDKSNDSKANMLNLLLLYLEHPEQITFDVVNYVSRPNDDDVGDDWDPCFNGINYTKEERELFPQKFKEVAAKIRKNLEENHALDVNINSPYSPYDTIPEVGN